VPAEVCYTGSVMPDWRFWLPMIVLAAGSTALQRGKAPTATLGPPLPHLPPARLPSMQPGEPLPSPAPSGQMAMVVLETRIFDFLNYRTVRLDPSYVAITAKAGVSACAPSPAP
jgi:hypothetical protein